MLKYVAVMGAAFCVLAGCSGSTLAAPDSYHTNATLLESLASLKDAGVTCEEWSTDDGETPGLVCTSGDQSAFDSLFNPTILTEEGGDLFEAYGLMVKGCEAELEDGRPVKDLYKDAFVIMGSNWVVLSPISRKSDADLMTAATGGMAYPYLEWCAEPVRLGVEG